MYTHQKDFDINRQMLLEWLRLHNPRKGDKIRIVTKRDGEFEGTYHDSYFGWIHTNRYGQRKRTKSSGASWRIGTITIKSDYLDDIHAQDIIRIEYLGDSSRRRTNPYHKVCDISEDFRRAFSKRTRNIQTAWGDLLGDVEYRVLYEGKPCLLGLITETKQGWTVELRDSKDNRYKVSGMEFLELPICKRNVK